MFVIGKVLKPQGIKGEVKVEIITSFPEQFVSLDSVYIEENQNWQAYPIEAVRLTDRFVFLKFRGIDSIEQAEKIRNKFLCIQPDDLKELEANEFYIHDLVGLQVIDEFGNYLGDISDVEAYPANDVYVLKTPDGQLMNIPAIKEVVKKVDLDTGKMIIHVMDGLFD